jgi:PAS domain S-box-containing protein
VLVPGGRQVKDERRTKKQLIEELHRRITELEASEKQCKKMEQKLRVSERRFIDIAENALEWIWEVDIEGKYTYVSPVVEKVLGYKPEEVLEKHFYDLFHPEDREELKKAAFEVFVKKQSFRVFENRCIHRNGQSVWLSTSGVPTLDQKGNLLGYRGADTDITERKRAEGAVQESEEFSSSLLTNSPNPIVVINADTSIRYANPALEELTDFSSAELIGTKAPYPWWTEETLQKTSRDLQKAMRRGAKRLEELFQRKNGEQFWVEITSTPIRSNGHVKYYLANWVDITERKRAEEQLQESERKYRALTESSLTGIFIHQEGKYVFVNDRFAQIHKYRPAELLGKGYLTLIHPDESKSVEQRVSARLKGKNVLDRYEVRRVRKDGKTIWCEMMATTIEYAGRPAVMGNIIDITERKNSELLLRQSEREKALILNSVSDVVTYQDNELRIRWANRMAAKSAGLSADELVGHNCYEIWHQRSTPCVGCPVVRAFETSESKEGEITTPDGRVWFVRACPVLQQNGDVVGVVEAALDITNRKQAEEDLRGSREELRNLSAHLQSVREQERTTIAREIHDELGQALTVLKLDLSWLGKRFPKNREILIQKTKSMSGFIDNTIRTVQRISSELRPGILDDLGLSAAMEWQADEFKKRTGIECELTLQAEDSSLPKDLSTTIFRIFQETLTNIARHANATMVKISLKEKAGKFVLKVRDNGKGITQKQISDSGSFGLIGIRERAQFFGGDVKIVGVRNKGTTVRVSVPINKS